MGLAEQNEPKYCGYAWDRLTGRWFGYWILLELARKLWSEGLETKYDNYAVTWWVSEGAD